MLTLLTGTDVSAKKDHIYAELSALAGKGKTAYLLVPEQSSFDRDREFLFRYGEKLSNRIKVTSFTHICRDILEEKGLRVKPEADEAARSVLMSLAVEDCSDSLDVYSRHSGRSALIGSLLSEYSEIKQAGLTPEELGRVSTVLGGSLRKKAGELSRIFSAYEARLSERFSESTDNIRVVTEYLKEEPYFAGAELFFDDFRGFTGAQLKLLDQIFRQAEQCSVSVTVPGTASADGTAFVHARRTERQLIAAADRGSVRCVRKCTDIGETELPLGILRDSLFSYEPEIYDGPTDKVTVFRASDKYAECDFAAMEIRRLLAEEDYRCRDIAVFERGSGYADAMTSSLKKYGIPVFTDKRAPLSDYPLVRMVLAAARIASEGFSTEDIFMLIKTDIAGIDPADCALLEDYVRIWQKDRNDWINAFTDNPDGFGVAFTEDCAERLARINGIREKIVLPLMTLKNAFSRQTGEGSCRAVYGYLMAVGADENFCKYAEYLNANGREAEAVRCTAVWEQVMESLDALSEALSGRTVSPRRFAELLKIILSSGDVGRIPAGCDQIIIGTAGRTRFTGARAVFVLGANEGVFPASAEPGGLFSARERRLLSENDFVLENLPENIYAEERCIAYQTLNTASERLYVSYSASSISGASLQPSEIVGETKKLFPGCVRRDSADVTAVERIGSVPTAFEEYARCFRDGSPLAASLKKYLSEQPGESGRLSSLERAADKAPAAFADPEKAAALFGRDMYMSASKAESYHKCPFMYFCRYGMGAEKRRPAGLDARITGLLVHHVLEKILLKYKNSELAEMSPEELRAEADALTEAYISEYMGGRDDMGGALNRSLDRVKNDIFEILTRLVMEFGSSSFETRDVELEISEKGDVRPYKIEIPGGGSITISGFVDRVDVMEDGGKAYLRVIDYKTGGKNFRLSDIFDGLNMQMLIYLMCLWDNGGERYGDVVPAGVLYVPAKTGGEKLSRNASPEDVLKTKLKNGRMNGILLESETVLRGMESAAEGRYLTAQIDKNGKLKGTFLSLADFALLHKKIDRVLAETGAALHRGDIAAMPILDGDYKHTCLYCDYNDVCLREENDPYRTLTGLAHQDAVALLEKEEAENNG